MEKGVIVTWRYLQLDPIYYGFYDIDGSIHKTLSFVFSRLGSPLSSDSDSLGEEPFPFRSPRGTSSRGRATAGTTKPRSPRKSYKVFFV